VVLHYIYGGAIDHNSLPVVRNEAAAHFPEELCTATDATSGRVDDGHDGPRQMCQARAALSSWWLELNGHARTAIDL
jgi:hypothetical protein